MRARWPIFFLLALPALLAYPQYKPFYNQYNFAYGTKAMSMGNAFSAVADDLTAVFWNPAGLADKRAPEFYFAYQAESLKQGYDPQEADYLGTRLRYDFNLASKLKQINFFSVSVPAEFWKMKWGFALSYYRFIPYGFKGSAVEPFTFPPAFSASTEVIVNFIGSEGVDVLAFSGAAGITEFFSLGCTVQQFFSSGSLHLQFLNRSGEFDEQYSESLRGRNLILGLMFRPFETLNLAFTYHSGVKSNFDSSLLTWQVDDEGTDVNVNSNSSLARVIIPSQYSLGAALRPWRWLNLSFDYSRIDWRRGTLEAYYDFATPLPYPQKAYLGSQQQDVRNLRLGMEIDLPLRRLLLHFRGGWSSDGQLYADSSGQAVKVSGYAAGMACEFGNSLLLEIAFQRQSADWPEVGYFTDEPAVSSHYSADLLKFSLTYRFGRIFKE
ncbi:MAG: hypothetical protein NTW95_10165 [Candidatus Aminicenantes bacterium]|nr:hypothetical protein [Candidatus Aminicenantes bacterium]